MQLHDGIHQTEAKTYAVRVATVVRAIESPCNEVTLARADAGSAVTDAHDAIITPAGQCELNTAILRAKFHGVVDKVCDRLEQQIAIATHDRLDIRRYLESDPFILGDRLVQIADLAHDVRQ